MSEFERQLPSYRLIETHFGDDLQAVAARELGDANRWPELVWLNSLVHPYITDDEQRLAPGVLLSGSLLKVPAPTGVYSDAAEKGQVYERDCWLNRKLLSTDEGGDIAILSGADNLRQQIEHRVITPRGQARRHPEYGCLAWRLLGTKNGPVAGALASTYVKSAIAADYRIKDVPIAQAEVLGDSIKITAKAIAIEGGVIDLAYDT